MSARRVFWKPRYVIICIPSTWDHLQMNQELFFCFYKSWDTSSCFGGVTRCVSLQPLISGECLMGYEWRNCPEIDYRSISSSWAQVEFNKIINFGRLNRFSLTNQFWWRNWRRWCPLQSDRQQTSWPIRYTWNAQLLTSYKDMEMLGRFTLQKEANLIKTLRFHFIIFNSFYYLVCGIRVKRSLSGAVSRPHQFTGFDRE